MATDNCSPTALASSLRAIQLIMPMATCVSRTLVLAQSQMEQDAKRGMERPTEAVKFLPAMQIFISMVTCAHPIHDFARLLTA